MVAASIRYNNPGAQWDGPIAKKWGSKQHVILADGQANHIAIFDTKVQGAAAEFDLWRNNYCNLTLQGAIAKWCGGNSPAAYMNFLESKTGIRGSDIVTPALLASAKGLALMKAQAQWEAGQDYPMSAAEWQQAQAAVFKGTNIPTTTPVVAGGGVAGGTVVVAQQAHAAGYHWGAVIGILAVGLIIAAVVYIILMKSRQDGPFPVPVPVPSPEPTPTPRPNPIPPGPARGPIAPLPGAGAKA